MYRKNAWKKYADDNSVVMDFAEKYKHFLSECKTERLVTRYAIKLLEENGYVFADKVKSVKKGDKIYFTNKNKNVAAFIIGEKPLAEGMRILGAHIDSPRLDLKENPIYESKGFAMGNSLLWWCQKISMGDISSRSSWCNRQERRHSG